MGAPPLFSAVFTKGNNSCDFLHVSASLDSIAFQNGVFF